MQLFVDYWNECDGSLTRAYHNLKVKLDALPSRLKVDMISTYIDVREFLEESKND